MSNKIENLIVGKIIKIAKHPNADRLYTAEVDIDREESLKVIFGQMAEVEIGDLVPVAVAPTKLPTGIDIECRKIRGVITEGMLCLDSEFVLGGEKKLTKFHCNTAIGAAVSDVIGA